MCALVAHSGSAAQRERAHLDGIEAVRAQILGERRVRRHLGRIDAELLGDDGLHLLLDRRVHRDGRLERNAARRHARVRGQRCREGAGVGDERGEADRAEHRNFTGDRATLVGCPDPSPGTSGRQLSGARLLRSCGCCLCCARVRAHAPVGAAMAAMRPTCRCAAVVAARRPAGRHAVCGAADHRGAGAAPRVSAGALLG